MLDQLRHIPVEFLQRGRYQPRSRFSEEELTELADSIREQGVVEPLVVRPLEGGRFEIIAGERRWRASQQAGMPDVPCVVREYSDEEAAAVTLIENLQREDLTPIEEAVAFRRMVEEFELSVTALAKRLGRSRPSVANQIRLLDLVPQLREMVDGGELKAGSARAMLGLSEADQLALAKETVKKGLNTRQVERRVAAIKSVDDEPARRRDRNLDAFETELSQAVGNPVSVEFSVEKRTGEVRIKYHSLEELEGIAERLKKT